MEVRSVTFPQIDVEKFMRTFLFIVLLAVSTQAIAQDEENWITISGIMHHSTLEGGCWYLQTSLGKRYELVGDTGIVYPLRVEGQHIVIKAEPTKGMASICMLGDIVRVLARIDTVRYPIDLPISDITVSGKIYRTKSGVWYLRTSTGARYEYKHPPQKRYRHSGAKFHGSVRVLMDKNSTREHMDGVIISDNNPQQERARPRTYDNR